MSMPMTMAGSSSRPQSLKTWNSPKMKEGVEDCSVPTRTRHGTPLAFLAVERLTDDVGGSRRVQLLGKAQLPA